MNTDKNKVPQFPIPAEVGKASLTNGIPEMLRVIQGNKLIAEFMGAPLNDGGEYYLFGLLPCLDDTNANKHSYFASELLFHSSWDWVCL